ncbi:hypothetical protein CL658_05515 [bacterium]|nr:hypothetical protein [bacterium]
MTISIPEYIKQWLQNIFTRFPLEATAIVCWCMTLISKLFLHDELQSIDSVKVNSYLIIDFMNKLSALCIPLFLMCTLSIKNYAYKKINIYMYAIAGLFLVLYTMDTFVYKEWGSEQIQRNQDFFITITMIIISITCVPFLKGSVRQFWVVNNILFIKLLKTVTYCFALLVSLNIIFLIFDYTTKLKIQFWVYQLGFIMIGCGFGPLYFLSEIPVFNKKYDNDVDLPKFYSIFSTAYLLPVSVGTLIGMYIATISFLIKQMWPPMEMQILFIVTSNIILFLIFQFELLSSTVKNKYVVIFLRYIYISIVPLAILFLIQLIRYVSQEGITEFWYLIGSYMIWIVGICTYFIISNKKDIRVIPISLCVVLIMLLIEPLKPYTISVNSQYNHLIQMLKHNHTLDEKNKIALGKTPSLSSNDIEAIKNKLYFLENHNALNMLKEQYPYPIDKQAITIQRLIDDLGLKL